MQNYVEKDLSLCDSPQWRLRDPSLHRFDRAQWCDGQTHGQTPRPRLRRAKHCMLSRVKWVQTLVS